jgi:hypothetical protein
MNIVIFDKFQLLGDTNKCIRRNEASIIEPGKFLACILEVSSLNLDHATEFVVSVSHSRSVLW